MQKIAADTNVFVRLLVKDDAKQVEQARRLFLGDDQIVVRSPVLLEIEWVLRGVFRFDRQQIAEAFKDLLALPGVVFTEEAASLQAIEWHAEGMDFADALHLAGADDCDELVTFDRDFASRARTTDAAVPVRLL